MDVRLAIALLFLAGCSSAPVGAEPQPVTNHDAVQQNGDDDDSDTTKAPSPKTAPMVPAASSPSSGTPAGSAAPVQKPSLTWTGSITKSDPVKFGGNPYCDYTVELSDVHVSVTLDTNGNIQASHVTSVMTESTTSACPYSPLGTLPLVYAASGTNKGLSSTSTVTAGPNVPVSTLSITGTMTDPGKMHAKLVFHRTDAADSLNWTVNTELDLADAAGQDTQAPK
jgi:hypothetical protein